MKPKRMTCGKILVLGLALGMFLPLCWPARSQAKTLEEILKEKGVITAAEYQQVTKDQVKARYKAGKGLTIVSADGNSKLQLGGYAQLLYTYTDKDAPGSADISNFSIRRFKLVLRGTLFSKNFGYRFQGDVSNGFRTEDAYINYKFMTPLKLQVGQYKPPQARQELTGAGKQLFPERSLANDTFNLGRDLGVQASGSFADKLVQYRLGIFNGNGPDIKNVNNHHMFAGRIDINPLGAYKMDEAGWPRTKPLVNIGASTAWEKVTAADVGSNFNKDNDVMDVALNLDNLSATDFTTNYGQNLTWWLWTANLNATWMGATFASEYYRLNANPDLGKDWSAHGYYVQGGYQIIPNKVEVGVRYTAIKSTDTNASAKFDKAETQVGLNYYFRKHLAKLQSDITFVNDDMTSHGDDTIFRMQAQFYY